MKAVLIAGAGGSAGSALAGYLQSKAVIFAYDHSALDITDEKLVRKVIRGKKPDLIFNCAAYTRVDEAEEEPELAYRVNVEGPRILARALGETGGKLVHLSTDYVFDGKRETPYRTDDPVGPLSVYAQTKAEGELAVLDGGKQHLIVRVAWIFKTGGKTFLSKLKELIMKEKHLRVADDREGACTYAIDLAEALWAMAERDAGGLYHFTNSGSCSWHGFAEQLIATAKKLGFPVKTEKLERISSKSLPMKALRPGYSVLDLSKTVELLGKAPRPWQETLADFLTER